MSSVAIKKVKHSIKVMLRLSLRTAFKGKKQEFKTKEIGHKGHSALKSCRVLSSEFAVGLGLPEAKTSFVH